MDNRMALLGGLGLGAGLMYLMDPDRGRRRRALARDRMVHSWHVAGDALGTTAHDVGNRTKGLVAETRSRFTREQVADAVLAERVRARVGHIVSHARSIHVDVFQGRVTLSGPILAREVDALIAAVAGVRGVKGVENRLEAHERPENVPGLQNGSAGTETELALPQSDWSPTARLVVGVTGGALATYGASRRDALGAATGALGIGLLAQGISNMGVKRLVGVGGGRRAVTLQKTINIRAPLATVFQFWAEYENFPHWMSHVREVRDLGDGRSHWVVDGPAGIPVGWDAVLTAFVANERIAWQSAPGAAIRQSGTVRFEPAPAGATRVHLQMTYSPPGGALGHGVATLFGANPKRRMDDDLARMKTLIETGTPPRDAAKPSSPGRDPMP